MFHVKSARLIVTFLPVSFVSRKRVEASRPHLLRPDLDALEKTVALAYVSEDTLKRFCSYGTPRDIIAHMEKIFDAGVDVFELGTPHGVHEVDAVRLLGEEVLPYFES